MGISGLIPFLFILEFLAPPALLAPLQPICDPRVMDKYILEAQQADQDIVGDSLCLFLHLAGNRPGARHQENQAGLGGVGGPGPAADSPEPDPGAPTRLTALSPGAAGQNEQHPAQRQGDPAQRQRRGRGPTAGRGPRRPPCRPRPDRGETPQRLPELPSRESQPVHHRGLSELRQVMAGDQPLSPPVLRPRWTTHWPPEWHAHTAGGPHAHPAGLRGPSVGNRLVRRTGPGWQQGGPAACSPPRRPTHSLFPFWWRKWKPHEGPHLCQA
ncbi:erythropoietin isoform X2 [Paroedura picta]|uniref:erythropoietin isoform X2 n=1 Tax=Paroedura picta TaxID=143630 RepID=UPI0040572688